MSIHPTAVIDPGAKLDSTVTVGPFAVIGPNVTIGANCEIGPHVVIDGHTTIGKSNRFYAGSSIGGDPQDKKYKGEPTKLIIGDGNTFREYVTLNTGTVQDGGLTSIGDDNWVMAYVHIAHDCHVGSHNILANATQVAGHVRIGDWVILGGMTGVHQFVSIGSHSMTASQTRVVQDIPPYVMAAGNPAKPAGINSEGLKRRGFTSESILEVKRAYKLLYRQGNSLEDAKELIKKSMIEAPDETKPAMTLLDEFLSASQRSIIR